MLTDHLGGESVAGVQMKTTYGWYAGGNGTNSSGFSGLPGGTFRPQDTDNNGAGFNGYWWSSTPSGYNDGNMCPSCEGYVAIFRSLSYYNDHLMRGYNANRRDGHSLRCIQDTPEVLGCIDPDACNYDELANTDDGSCEYESCVPAIHPCGDPVSYQGYEYATVQIGDQCWFAENLRNRYYQNGDSIPSGLSDSDWGNTLSGAVTVFGAGASDCTAYSPGGNGCDESWSLNEYGRLYNWHAVEDIRGLCPSGWHVPTDGEWTVLTDELGGESVAGQ